MDEELFNKISKALYDVLEETIADGTTAKSYVTNNARNGWKAWRKLSGRFDSKNSADRESAYQKILEPGRDPL